MTSMISIELPPDISNKTYQSSSSNIPYAIGWADDETGDYFLKIDKRQIKTVKTESETETELVLRLIPKPA
jgi:hypothetical protein